MAVEIPIPDDWDGVSTCRWSVCWPDSNDWKAILYGLIESPMRGAFWDFSTGNFLELREDFRPIYDYNFELRRCIMACDDAGLLAIAGALNNLADATLAAGNAQAGSNSGCCIPGAGGAGQSGPPFDPVEIVDPGAGDPPEGFESWEQYFANKCAVADYLVTRVVANVNNMKLINLVGLTVTSIIPILIGLLLDPIPGDEIAVIGGLLLATLAFGTAILDSAGDTLADYFDDLKCALYEAPSPEAAESAFESTFADGYDAGFPSVPYGFSVKYMINSLMGSAQVNMLFTLQTALNLPEADCSGCEQCVTLAEYLFTSDLEGWQEQTGDCESRTPNGTTSVAQNAGAMNMTATGGSGGLSAVISGITAIELGLVQPGQLLEIIAINNTSNNTFVAVDIVFDITGCVGFSATDFGNGAEVTRTFDLSSYAGENITDITIYVNNSISQSVDVDVRSVRVTCA